MIAETAFPASMEPPQPIASDNSPLSAAPRPAPGGASARPFGGERGAPSLAKER